MYMYINNSLVPHLIIIVAERKGEDKSKGTNAIHIVMCNYKQSWILLQIISVICASGTVSNGNHCPIFTDQRQEVCQVRSGKTTKLQWNPLNIGTHPICFDYRGILISGGIHPKCLFEILHCKQPLTYDMIKCIIILESWQIISNRGVPGLRCTLEFYQTTQESIWAVCLCFPGSHRYLQDM